MASPAAIVDQFRPELKPFESVYRDLHQHPELGQQEARTSAIAAAHLRQLGYQTTTHIGGYGVAGVLENGRGPAVLLRADMDALPIREETGLPYASSATTVDTDGVTKPVMHACGHDMHVAAMMAVASLLAAARRSWSGTLIILFQPDEEHGAGAQAMLDDKLYDRIPRPDVVLGQHVADRECGLLLLRSGPYMASGDTFKLTVFGRGGHGAEPDVCIDPIVLASSIVVRLQSVVARVIGPRDAAVVTCASIHGGKAHNVIPDEVELLLNVRTFDEKVREKVLAAVRRIIKGEALASGVEREPELLHTMAYPLTYNDPATTATLNTAFTSYFGERAQEGRLISASEDFSRLASAIGVPSVLWHLGSRDVEKWKHADAIPSAHQPNFEVHVEPTLRLGVDAMSLAALTFLSGV
jgi:amidohydrolase